MTFGQDTKLTGHMKLKLWVSAEESDEMDLIVSIKKLNRGGDEVHFYGHVGIHKGYGREGMVAGIAKRA